MEIRHQPYRKKGQWVVYWRSVWTGVRQHQGFPSEAAAREFVESLNTMLAREKELGILPAEIEGFHDIFLPQFFIQTGIELGNPTPVGIEAGQYGYFQLFVVFVLFLDIFLVQPGYHIIGDVK